MYQILVLPCVEVKLAEKRRHIYPLRADCANFNRLRHRSAIYVPVSTQEMLAATRLSESAIGPIALILWAAEIASMQVKTYAIPVDRSSVAIEVDALALGLDLDRTFNLESPFLNHFD